MQSFEQKRCCEHSSVLKKSIHDAVVKKKTTLQRVRYNNLHGKIPITFITSSITDFSIPWS